MHFEKYKYLLKCWNYFKKYIFEGNTILKNTNLCWNGEIVLRNTFLKEIHFLKIQISVEMLKLFWEIHFWKIQISVEMGNCDDRSIRFRGNCEIRTQPKLWSIIVYDINIISYDIILSCMVFLSSYIYYIQPKLWSIIVYDKEIHTKLIAIY